MYFFCLFFFLFFSSCTSLKKGGDFPVSGSKELSSGDIALFESAFRDMGKGEYSAVIPVFEELAKKYRGRDLEWPALYNLAGAYKETGRCPKAEKIYQSLLLKTKNMPHLKPRVYLGLAYVYECLGQAEKTLKALKEGGAYIHHLPEEFRLIEYPARLGAAHIRVGGDKTGIRLRQEVYRNLSVMKKSFRISSAADKNFARYFYIIGRSHIQKEYTLKLHRFLKMFFHYQLYLTQSVLLSADKWSAKAEKELGDLYRKMWFSLEKQKNKKAYQPAIQKILNHLKTVAQSSKSKKMQNIYSVLRKKTLIYLK